MALESATYISDLNAANPASTDGLAQADDHFRLIKGAVKATFPNVTGAISATHGALDAAAVQLPERFVQSQPAAARPFARLLCETSAFRIYFEAPQNLPLTAYY